MLFLHNIYENYLSLVFSWKCGEKKEKHFAEHLTLCKLGHMIHIPGVIPVTHWEPHPGGGALTLDQLQNGPRELWLSMRSRLSLGRL